MPAIRKNERRGPGITTSKGEEGAASPSPGTVEAAFGVEDEGGEFAASWAKPGPPDNHNATRTLERRRGDFIAEYSF